MVMVTLAQGITNINGQVGGDIWRYDVCGFHIQAAPRVIKRFRESKQTKAFGRCTTAWSNRDWTDTEIDKWWIWCKSHPKKNKKRETVYFHPFIAFIHINSKRILAGKEIIYEPP